MGALTVRSRTLVGFALGAVTMLVVTAVWMSAWSADAAPGDSDTTVVPITSCRLADTRPAFQVGPRSSPLGPKETDTVEVQNAATQCVGKVPASATGLLLNVTAVDATAPTFLTLWDEGPWPGTSSLNPVPGPPVPNAVTTKLASGGTFQIYNEAGSTHVIIDVVGYLTPTSLKELAVTAGAPGPAGPAGPAGPQGDKGDKGDKGDPGSLTTTAARLRGPDKSVPNNSTTGLNLEAANGIFGTFDTGGFFNAADPSLVTIPKSGIYLVSAMVNFSANATGYREVRLLQQFAPAGLTELSLARMPAAPTLSTTITGVVQLPAEAGDTLTVKVRQTSGGSLNASVSGLHLTYLGPKAP